MLSKFKAHSILSPLIIGRLSRATFFKASPSLFNNKTKTFTIHQQPFFRAFHSSQKLFREADKGTPLGELVEAKPRTGVRLAVLAKILGASAGLLIVAFILVLMGFPLADEFLLPFATKVSFGAEYQYENESSFKRTKEIDKFLEIFENEPTDVIILSGSNRGKTVLSKEIAEKSLYIDLSVATGPHSSVFEVCEQMMRPIGFSGTILASYFKLVFLVLNILVGLNGQRFQCGFNFFELWNYIHKALKMSKHKPDEKHYPVLFVDQPDWLVGIYETTKDKVSKEVFQEFARTVSRFSLRISKELKLAHVVLITSSQTNAEELQKKLGLKGNSRIINIQNLDLNDSRKFMEKALKQDKKNLLQNYFAEIYNTSKGCPLEMQRIANTINSMPNKDFQGDFKSILRQQKTI